MMCSAASRSSHRVRLEARASVGAGVPADGFEHALRGIGQRCREPIVHGAHFERARVLGRTPSAPGVRTRARSRGSVGAHDHGGGPALSRRWTDTRPDSSAGTGRPRPPLAPGPASSTRLHRICRGAVRIRAVVVRDLARRSPDAATSPSSTRGVHERSPHVEDRLLSPHGHTNHGST
jgi:hypothetical protein